MSDPATDWLRRVLHYDSNIQTYTGHPEDQKPVKSSDEGPGHPFRGNQYTEGESGGSDEPELPLVGGGSHEQAQKFLGGTKAKGAIKKAVKDWLPEHAAGAGVHILQHQGEVALEGAVLGGLVALGAPTIPALVAAGIAGYALNKLTNKLGITHEKAYPLLRAGVSGLRTAYASIKHTAHGIAQAGFASEVAMGGIGDAEDVIARGLRVFDETLASHTPAALVAAAHNFKGKLGDAV
jgi:hypothetical protein